MTSQGGNPVQPRNIVPLIAPHEMAAFAAAPTAQLTYHGGPLIQAVQVSAVFWGDTWQQAPDNALIPQVDGFFNFILQSSLMDALAEYGVTGQPIGPGQYLGSVTVTTPALGNTVGDGDIQQALQQWIQSQQVPQPNANSLYFIYLPPGVVSTNGSQSSCTQYCGYHSHINGQIFYAIEPYIDCVGCNYGTGIFDSLTKVSSHELCEAITDPALNGWWDDNSGDEIGDICNGSVTSLGGFTIQAEWSNSQNSCVIAP